MDRPVLEIALNDVNLPVITDDYMREMRGQAQGYTAVILRSGPQINVPGRDKIIWEHGRRNHALRAAGLMPIVLPVPDESDVNGISIFTTGPEETRDIMEGDPAVQAGIFTYEVHPCRGFPGDRLP